MCKNVDDFQLAWYSTQGTCAIGKESGFHKRQGIYWKS